MGSVYSTSDMEKVLNFIDAVAHDDFTYAKAESFDEPIIADKINAMLDAIMHRNNYFLARINDAQSRIAVNTAAREMLDSIESQNAPIHELGNARELLGNNLTQCSDAGVEALALAKQIKNTVEAFSQDEAQIIRTFEEITEIEDAGDDIYKVAVLKALPLLKSADLSLSYILPRIKDISGNINTMFLLLDRQKERAGDFLDCVDSITGNYDSLFAACVKTGKQLYRISRDIDEARNDMYRKNSWPLLHDRLKVFDTDHLTLTWRLFNHIAEFETLKISQVSNVDGCKFGTWINAQDDPDFLASDAYNHILKAHTDLHTVLLNCFLYKEAARREDAIAEFEKGLAAYQVFHNALEEVHEYFRSKGITKETEVWEFKE